MSPSVFWLIVFVLCTVIEASTVGLFFIWFAFGALATLIATGFSISISVQAVIFLAVSGASMLFLRPMAQKHLKPNHQATNADRLIGQTALVTETIDNIVTRGAVTINGQNWSAVSAHDVVIPSDSKVRILEIQGVRLIVERIST